MQALVADSAVPLALSSSGWTAIGAVGGAIVGATAGAILDTILGWRQDRRLVKAGARLVASDISVAEACLQNTKREGKWFAYYEFSTANWDEYRGVLAVKLDSADFAKVSQCIVTIRELDNDGQDCLSRLNQSRAQAS